ncbi:hypothetical protein OG946_18385 [Streptomyces sp. NBC_01808]|uniref:hypothetical protein n=1 Tax=Streptomyces sp. NBC_01808 TaxID=2975947 RepID=UPI002DDBAF3B|nr:hypothetical protein [Streptomyces sp. NBC_01808]WSA39152.1 hypothetical protein OG946_18385 [Streptomyces sp. NBC_01808]
MTMMRATGTAAMSASDVVYVEGWIPAVLIFAFVFAYVAYTDGGWNIAAGVAVLVVSGLFAFLMWRSLTDYPLTYKDGDRPTLNVDGTGLYQVWDLAPGASVSTVLEADGGSDAEKLAGTVRLGHGCEAARVRWRIGAGDPADESSAGISRADAPLASGTFGEGERRGLGEVPLLPEPPTAVLLTAVRLDDATCDTTLTWENPGFEGPGHGAFRFVFPVPSE